MRTLLLASALLLVSVASGAEEADREAMVRALLERSRLLEDVRFQIPTSVWAEYARETKKGAQPAAAIPPPLPMIAEEGTYLLTVGADHAATLAATLRLRVFDAGKCANFAVLSAAWAWRDVQVNELVAELATSGGWLRFSPDKPGTYLVTAKAPLKQATSYGGSLRLDVPRTVLTLLRVEAPEAWEVTLTGAAHRLIGSPDKGTQGLLAVAPRDSLSVAYARPMPVQEHAPRYELRGDVAWNLDAGSQQVAARLDVAIVGGRTDRIDLVLPSSAERLAVGGPDVREAQPTPGGATVFLRDRVAEHTRLDITYGLPNAKGTIQRFSELGVREGTWAGGTLVITNTAGGSELLQNAANGLRALALADIPRSASALLAGAPALAYGITSRSWSAEVDVLDLGEFALRESIADLAHYEAVFRDDGTMMCKANYEIRNRARQFLRLDLPRGSQILSARVNEKPTPLTPIAGTPDAYLLPLIRSTASVKGLVSFPVEVVLLCRLDASSARPYAPRGDADSARPYAPRGDEQIGRSASTLALPRRGELALPLPRIDLPIAYAWCESYLPEGLSVRRWSGPFQNVEKYSSETATASLGYGSGELAEGYSEKARIAPEKPTTTPARPAPKAEPKKPVKPRKEATPAEAKPPAKAPKPTKPPAKQPAPTARMLGADKIVDIEKAPPTRADLSKGGAAKPIGSDTATPKLDVPYEPVRPSGERAALLGRNYYRAGNDLYERGDYDSAARNFQKTIDFLPGSSEAENAKRLLGNIKLAQGKLQLQSRSEQAAAGQVRREQAFANEPIERQQKQFLEEGLAYFHRGDPERARKLLQSAIAAGDQLIAQGADRGEQDARLRAAREELKKLDASNQARVKELRTQFEDYVQRGESEKALKLGLELRRITTSSGVASVGKLQSELDDLALRAAKQKASQQTTAANLGTIYRPLRAKAAKQVEMAGLPQELDALVVDLARADPGALSPEKQRLRDAIAYFGTIKSQYPPAHARYQDAKRRVNEALSYLGKAAKEKGEPPVAWNNLIWLTDGEKLKTERDAAPGIDLGLPQGAAEGLADARAPAGAFSFPDAKKLPEAKGSRIGGMLFVDGHLENIPGDAQRLRAIRDRWKQVTEPGDSSIQPSVEPLRRQLAELAPRERPPGPRLTPEGKAAEEVLGRYRQETVVQRQQNAFTAQNFVRLAKDKIEMGDLRGALRDYAKAAQLDESNKEAQDGLRRARGMLGADERRFGDIAADYAAQRAVTTSDQAGELKALLADAKSRFDQGQYRDAIEGFTRVQAMTRYLAPMMDVGKAEQEAASYIQRALRKIEETRIADSRQAREAPEKAAAEIRKQRDDKLDILRQSTPDVWKEIIPAGEGETALAPERNIRGKVVGVDKKLGLVILNAGQRQGVKKGDSFIVFRGSDYVGKVIVQDVTTPDTCAARYDKTVMRSDAEVGDDAALRLMVEFGEADGPARAQAAGGRGVMEAGPGVATTVPTEKNIRGKVVGVDKKLGLVILNAGQRQGIKKGDSFIIFRDSDYVGKVTVQDVTTPDTCAARYDKALMKSDTEVGDDAALRLMVEGLDMADGPVTNWGAGKDLRAEWAIQPSREQVLAARRRELNKTAQVLFEQKRYDEARKACDEILRAEPGDAAALAMRQKATAQSQLIESALKSRHLETEAEWNAARAMEVPQGQLVDKARDRFEEVRSRTVQTAFGGELREMPPWEAKIREALNKKVSFDFVETPLEDAVTFLSNLVDVTIVLDTEAIKDDPKTVTLRVNDMRLESALNWLLKLVGLKYALKDEAIFISTPARLLPKPVARMYDVSDIERKERERRLAAREKADEYALGRDFFGTEDQSEEESTQSALLDTIKKTIEPGTWSEDDGEDTQGPARPQHYTIRYRDGRFIVNHTPEVQARVEEFLAAYRAGGKRPGTGREAEPEVGQPRAAATSDRAVGGGILAEMNALFAQPKAAERPAIRYRDGRIVVTHAAGLDENGDRAERVSEPPGPEAPPWEKKVREALQKKISFDFVETPLQDVVTFIASLVDVTIVLDTEAIKDEPKTVTLKVNDMRLESALNWVLKLCGLAYALKDEAILITKPEKIAEKPSLRVYDVSDLLAGRRGRGAEEEEPLTSESLVEFVKKTIAPGTWMDVGEATERTANHTVIARHGRLAVVHTPEVQKQVEDLLGNLAGAPRRPMPPRRAEEPARKFGAEERRPFTIAYRNGRIVVVHTPEIQEQIEDLMSEFRPERGGPEAGRAISGGLVAEHEALFGPPAAPLPRKVDYPIMRMYDVTDLTIDIKNFQGRQQALASDGGYSSTGGAGALFFDGAAQQLGDLGKRAEARKSPLNHEWEGLFAQTPSPPAALDVPIEDISIQGFDARPGSSVEPPSNTPVFGAGAGTSAGERNRGIYSGRFNREGGQFLGGGGGSSRQAESTVNAGLIWLAKAQEKDGHWDSKFWDGESNYDVGMTGLAFLVYQGAGYTHTKGKYRDTVSRGLDWLRANQKPNGAFGYRTFWEQGIATMAVCEAYGMTRSESVRGMAQKAVDFIVQAQPEHGGFGIRGAVARKDGDMFATGWAILAIKSAICSDLNVPVQAIDRSRVFLKNTVREYGGSASVVSERNSNPTSTAIGMLCRQFIGGNYDAEINAAANSLIEHGRKAGAPAGGKQMDTLVGDPWFTYFSAAAMFQMGGEYWIQWNRLYRDPLVKLQETKNILDGKGRFIRGSWDPANHFWGDQGGRVFTTAMAALSLEIYYRFLPVYRSGASPAVAAPPAPPALPPPGAVERAYDVRDLVQGKEEDARELERRVREVVGQPEGEKQPYTIAYRNGRIVVVHTAAGQEQVATLLTNLRQAAAPQVEMGTSVARQELKRKPPAEVSLSGGTLALLGEEFKGFVARNYEWQGAPERRLPELAQTLRRNLGQAVDVNSVNLNADAAAARGLGVAFNPGRNGLSYGVIDDAQFRTLLELDARQRRSGAAVAANGRAQSTIIGTDALVANGMVANLAFAADRGNRLNIADNPIELPHESYVLINNGGYLTAVRAGAMQPWREATGAVAFVEVPQDIPVPRVGRLARFEKTLVKPSEELVIRASYRYAAP